MKFLDQVKIYIKAGDGGSGSQVLEEKNLSNSVAQMVEMVVEVDLSFLNQKETLTLL